MIESLCGSGPALAARAERSRRCAGGLVVMHSRQSRWRLRSRARAGSVGRRRFEKRLVWCALA